MLLTRLSLARRRPRCVPLVALRQLSQRVVGSVVFQNFLKALSTDFDIDKVQGCGLTTEPVSDQLIGRQVELREILDILTANLSEGSRYPVIQMAAPPGSGKSAFLAELTRIFLDQTDHRRGHGEMFSNKQNTVRE